MSIWTTLGTLSEYLDVGQFFSLGDSMLNAKVITGFLSGGLAEESFIQTGILMMLVMSYVASAYVILCSI